MATEGRFYYILTDRPEAGRAALRRAGLDPASEAVFLTIPRRSVTWPHSLGTITLRGGHSDHSPLITYLVKLTRFGHTH